MIVISSPVCVDPPSSQMREMIAAYEAARVEREQAAREALKAEKEGIRERAAATELKLAERLKNHSFIP
eukprot:6917941-Pyramimonas_sp.AAC.1